MKFFVGLLASILSIGAVVACGSPSTYPFTSADTALVQSLHPKIDALFAADHIKGNKMMMQIKDISENFAIDTREYYILREIHLYMNAIIANTIDIPTYISSGGNLFTYMKYSPMAFDAAVASGKRVVINFRASRCPRCKATSEELIAHQTEIPNDVIILEADFDSTKSLQTELGVIMQTTFVFFDDQGMMTKKVEKLTGIDQLLEEL